MSDIANAQQKLLVAQGRLREALADSYCCEHSEKVVVGKAKKQVKRWETWLADREVLAGGPDTSEEAQW